MRVEKRKLEQIKRRKFLFTVLLLVFLALFFISAYNIVTWFLDNNALSKELEYISNISNVSHIAVDLADTNVSIFGEEQVSNSDNPYWDYIKMDLIDVDFSTLKQENSDTVAWIEVSGTNINYPIVQTTDNSYYLKHSFKKDYNRAGWVFMDYRNNAKNFDRNTIIYAHNRADSTMFGSLKNIFKDTWLNNTNNHIVRISTETENTLWQVFSVYHISTTDDYLQTTFRDGSEFINFINTIQGRSLFDFNTTVSVDDKILTLSTCYGADTERTVLHAKLIKKYTKEQ